MELLFGLAALVTFIGGLLGIGRYLDEIDDPLTNKWRDQVGQWLGGQGTGTLASEVRRTSQVFAEVFDRLFAGQGTLIEHSIWTGLLFSPAMLLLIRAGLMVAPGEAWPQTADLLLLSIVMAILLTLTAILGYLWDRWTDVLGGVLGGVLGVVLYVVLYVVLGGGLDDVLVGVLGGGLGGGLYGVLVGVGIVLGGAGIRLIQIPFPVHPLRALASSLGFMVLVGLIRLDDAQGFLNAARDSGLKSLAFVAFNMFADGVSLLETRWVIQRVLKASIPRLAALMFFDLIASAIIFLTLPALLGELPDFLRGALFQGERPWLGIFFWTTFSTSFIFYAFVAAVFLLILPKHGVARAFHRLIGGIITVEKRPFTALTMAMSLVILTLAIGGVIYDLLKG